MQAPGRIGRACASSRAEHLKTRRTLLRARQDHLQTLCLGVIQRQSFTDRHVLDGPIPTPEAEARSSAHHFQVAGRRKDDSAEYAMIAHESMRRGTEAGLEHNIPQGSRVDPSLRQRMQCRYDLRLPGTRDFPIHEVPFTLERVGGQTYSLSRIIAIESLPIDIRAMRVKLAEAGQQFRPIIAT